MPRQQQQTSGKKSLVQTRQQTALVPPPFVTTQRPSFGQTVKEGFAFGVGSSVANSLVRSFFGSALTTPSQSPSQSPSQNPTDPIVQSARSVGASSTQDMSGQVEYLQCMKEGGTEEVCKQYMI
jgi:hypothetical protein